MLARGVNANGAIELSANSIGTQTRTDSIGAAGLPLLQPVGLQPIEGTRLACIGSLGIRVRLWGTNTPQLVVRVSASQKSSAFFEDNLIPFQVAWQPGQDTELQRIFTLPEIDTRPKNQALLEIFGQGQTLNIRITRLDLADYRKEVRCTWRSSSLDINVSRTRLSRIEDIRAHTPFPGSCRLVLEDPRRP